MGNHNHVCCGVYYLAYWKEQGKEQFSPIASADTETSSAKRCPLLSQFLERCTQIIPMLATIALYVEIVKTFKDLKMTSADSELFSTIPDEVFSLQTLLLNV